jgi:hypothetical protein
VTRNREEEQHCMAYVEWCGLAAHTFPELAAIYHIPNGGARPYRVSAKGKRYSVEGEKLKRMGVKAGVWDYHLPVARVWEGVPYMGVWIEFKSKDGRLSKEQKEFGRLMRRLGHALLIVNDWEEAKLYTIKYLGMPQGAESVGRAN